MHKVVRFSLAAALAAGVLVLGAISPAAAGGRTSVNIGLGFGFYGAPYYPAYRPYYGGYYGGYYGYPYYYPNYYYAPPPVAYAPPPVIYSTPPVVVSQAPPMSATATSPSYTAQNGQTCREFQSTAVIGGQSQPIYGTACLQPDGAWRVVR